MKGQYLAVETVFTFGLGLIVAIGVITLFHQYRVGVMDGSQEEQAEMVSSQVLMALNSLKSVDEPGSSGSGSYSIDLPDNVAGKSYSIRMSDELVVKSGNSIYRTEIDGFNGYNMVGSVRGGDITVFKEQDKFLLRAQ